MTRATPGRGSVAELTAALAAGLHARRFAEPPPFAPPAPVEVAAPLLPVAGLLGHPAGATRVVAGPLIRLARRAAKGLLRPWLDLQTRFNHASIGVLGAVEARTHAGLAELYRRCAELEAALARTAAAHDALAQRVAELARPEPPPAAPARLTERAIRTVFIHTRLPAPPARFLDVGAVGGGGPELAAIGYDVATRDVPGAPLPHPDVAFDAVLLGGAGRPAEALLGEVRTVLRPGGRVILTAPAADSPWTPERPPPGFRMVECSYAVETGCGWVFTTDRPDDGRTGLALVVAEKTSDEPAG